MDIQYYRYFLTIAECGSVSKAAEKLYTNQPYLSKIISRLEREFGTILFNRRSLPLRLTAEGECFAHYARQITESDDRLHKELQSGIKGMRSFTIGTVPGIEAQVMPPVVSALGHMHPSVRFKVISSAFSDLISRLEKNEIQMVFGLQYYAMGKASLIPVIQDRMLLAIPPEHRLFRAEFAGKAGPMWFSAEKLDKERFIMPPAGSYNRQRFDLVLSARNIIPDVYMESNNFDAVYQMISSNFGISFIPETTVKHMLGWEKLNYVAVEDPLLVDTLSLAFYHEFPYTADLIRLLQKQYEKEHLERVI